MSSPLAPPATTPPRLEDFPLRSFDKLRYGDTDRQGHVNNSVFTTLLETGRVELFHQGDARLMDPGCSFVIAHLSLDFLAELHWPGQIDIGTGVIGVGRSSVRLEQALFQGERVAARAQTVIVQVSDASRRGQAFSERAIAYLAPFRVTARA
jgi:acyl-CoA thioester hydrolase